MQSEIDNIQRYPIELFLKYKEINRKFPEELEGYVLDSNYVNTHNGAKFLKHSTYLSNPEVRANINFLINKKSMTGLDEELYEEIQYRLNKLNIKNFNEISQEIMDLPYSKEKHIYRLTELITIKGIREPILSHVYAELCQKFLPYYIECNNNSNDGKNKVYFRTVLLTICQDMFSELITNNKGEIKKASYERSVSYDTLNFTNLCRFLAELYKIGFINGAIINLCIDKIFKYIDKKEQQTSKFESLKEIIIHSSTTLYNKDKKLFEEIKTKVNNIMTEEKYHDLESKFHTLEIQEKLQTFK